MNKCFYILVYNLYTIWVCWFLRNKPLNLSTVIPCTFIFCKLIVQFSINIVRSSRNYLVCKFDLNCSFVVEYLLTHVRPTQYANNAISEVFSYQIICCPITYRKIKSVPPSFLRTITRNFIFLFHIISFMYVINKTCTTLLLHYHCWKL